MAGIISSTGYKSKDLSHLILHGVKVTGEELGRGAFGRVFEVDHGGTRCAAKEIHELLLQYSQGEALEKLKDDFVTECSVWSTLRHPNVVLFLGIYYPLGDESGLPVMVMEKMQESIRSLVEKYEDIPFLVKLSILHDVCLGLRYLHGLSPAIIHRDLSTNNILVTPRLEAKITDLGQAKLLKMESFSTMSMAPGTVIFMPPEALENRPIYGPQLDIFSLGAVTLHLVTLHLVTQVWPSPSALVRFDEETGRREMVPEVTRRREHIDKMSGAAADLVPLVVSCLEDNPNKRPQLKEVTDTIATLISTYVNDTTRDGMDVPTWLCEISGGQDMLPCTELSLTTLDMFKEPVNIDWEEGNPAPKHRISHTAVLLRGSVFVGSGFQMGEHSYQIDIFNPDNNSWNAIPIKTPHCWFGMAVLNNKLVIVGGWVKEKKGMFKAAVHKVTNKILILNTGQWSDYSKMPTARSSAAATSHRSMLIVVGGIADDGSKLGTTELLDTVTDTWYTCDTLPKPHYQLQPVIIGNMFYLSCGLNDQCESSTSVYAAPLDSLSKHELHWEAPTDTPWQYSVPVGVYGAHLLVIGGGRKDDDNVTVTSSICAYHPVNRAWNMVANLPAPRLQSSAICVADNRIVVMGGRNNTRGYINTVWIGQFQL